MIMPASTQHAKEPNVILYTYSGSARDIRRSVRLTPGLHRAEVRLRSNTNRMYVLKHFGSSLTHRVYNYVEYTQPMKSLFARPPISTSPNLMRAPVERMSSSLDTQMPSPSRRGGSSIRKYTRTDHAERATFNVWQERDGEPSTRATHRTISMLHWMALRKHPTEPN